MAKGEAQLTITLKNAVTKPLATIQSAWTQLGKRFVLTGADIMNGIKFVIGGIVELAEKAGQFQTVSTAFENLAASQGQSAKDMLSNMQQLSRGTISEMDLMRQANQAMLLGLPVERFGDMLEIARTSALATGQSMDFMLNSIVTGLGRGSKLMLDNLGIIFNVDDAYAHYAATVGKSVKDLSEFDKKQAFINEALAVGKKNAENAGAGTLTYSEATARLKAQVEDLGIKLGEKLLPLMTFVVEKTSALIDLFQKTGEKAPTKPIHEMATELDALKTKMDELNAEPQMNFFGLKTDPNKFLKKDLAERITLLEEQIAKEVELENKRLAYKQSKDAEAAASARETAQKNWEEMQNDEIMRQQLENELMDTSHLQQIDIMLRQIDDKLRVETDYHKRRALLAEKAQLTEARGELAREDARSKAMIAARADTLSTIATLQTSSNKTLATIGKAAAITQIAIDGPQAVTKALAAFPPPFNFVAAGLVGAAVAAQAAKVAGVQLEDGGIVQARPGGIQATIGEGGRDEAVIPLDGSMGGMGTTINIVVNGGLLGDPQSAQEFAQAVDRELLALRRNNSSLAFDSGVI